MSTLKTDAIEAATGTNTDLSLDGKGSGVPDLGAGFKVGGSVGVPTASIQDDAITLAKMAGLTRGSVIYGDSSGNPAALAVGGANTVLQSDGTDASYGTVATAMIADDAVTLAKMAAGTDGNLITYDASGNPAHVATGTATHVLTSNGAGAAPTFQAAGGGGAWSVKASGTFSSATEVDITGISKTTKFFFNSTFSNAGAQMHILTSSDGGTSYDTGSTDYEFAIVGMLSSTTTQSFQVADYYSYFLCGLHAYGNQTVPGTDSLELTLYDPANTSNYTMIDFSVIGVRPTGDDSTVVRGGGMRKEAAKVDAVRVKFAGASGTFSGNYCVIELN